VQFFWPPCRVSSCTFCVAEDAVFVSVVLLYIREQHEDIFTAVLLEKPTVSSLIHAVRSQLIFWLDCVEDANKPGFRFSFVKFCFVCDRSLCE